jgi:hypothetical protein
MTMNYGRRRANGSLDAGTSLLGTGQCSYHFGTAMAKIRGQLHNVPTIKPLVDANKL